MLTGVARLFSVNVVKLWFLHVINGILSSICKIYVRATYQYSGKLIGDKDKSSWP